MKNIQLPEKTQRRIVKYLGVSQHYLESQNELIEFFDMISPSLKKETIRHIFSNIVSKNQAFDRDESISEFVIENL